MVSRPLRMLSWALGMLFLGGCVYPVRDNTDYAVNLLVKQSLDEGAPADTSLSSEGKEQAAQPAPKEEPGLPVETPKGARRPLTIPPGLPGSNAPPIRVPLPDEPGYREKKEEAVRKYYPGLPPVGKDPVAQPGPDGKPLTLADLQRLAMANNPTIRQAASDVEGTRGAAIKAAAYPNPNVGYEADTAGTGATAGFQGGFIDQLIKTGGKLKLAWAAAMIDLANAQLALRRAQTDVMAQVRGGYFAVLVARENMRINQALVTFTDRVYQVQLDLLASPAAFYEPMALRVLAYQARINLLQARNRYASAWKQLAASLGLPGMPLTELAGRVDLPVPVYDFARVQQRMLNTHTDVLTARNGILKARYNLKLAQVTPVPDLDVRLVVQKDFTAPPFQVVHSVQVTAPLPVWDNNKGGIVQAQGALVRAIEEPDRVRAALTTSLADAFERYENNRRTVAYYRDRILPDQVRVYKGTYERHWQVPGEVGFQDVVTAQQTLAAALTTYTATLALQWQAVVDVANLMQTNDLFRIGDEVVPKDCVAPLEPLEELQALPCCHPSSPVHDPRLKGADPTWPPALPNDTAGPPAPADKGKPPSPSKHEPVRKPEEAQVLAPEKGA